MNEWIKCCEKMPEVDQLVLVYQKGGVHGGYEINLEYRISDDLWSEQGCYSNISHWMPLPDIPK